MRKESVRICQAFIDGKTARAARTWTNGTMMFLHDNPIAVWDVDARARGKRVLHLCCCGWPSVTTKDRLNTLLRLLGLRAGYFTHKHQLYFGSILRSVDSNETITIDVDLALELSNDNASHHQTIAA